MPGQNYDAIVLGMGGMGSAALFHLAKRGLRVLGIDQHPIAHSFGSSHGQTRVIRKAYFEHPAYVRLLERAYQNWQALESEVAQTLLVKQGVLEVGPPEGMLVQGILRACAEHGLLVEQIPEQEFAGRFPGFRLPANHVALYEAEGGMLFVEQCVAAYCQTASAHGATLLPNTPVVAWSATDSEVCVTTSQESFRAARLVVCAGAWSGALLAEVGLPLRVLRKHLHWFEVDPGSYQQQAASPCFFYETPVGCYYGFPQLTGAPPTIKVAEHTGGEELDQPSNLNRQPNPEEFQRVLAFLQAHLPAVRPIARQHDVCMYTMTPDEHFILDQHPTWPTVCFAAGMSGHGFKFASVIGEILADLAVGQHSSLPFEFLRLARFGQIP